MAIPLYIPTVIYEVRSFTFLLIPVVFVIKSIVVGMKWYLIWIWLAFSFWLTALNIFSCAYYLQIFLGEVIMQIFCPFLNWVICIRASDLQVFYIFWTQVLYQIWFTNILSHSVVFLFAFLMVSFDTQSFKILDAFYQMFLSPQLWCCMKLYSHVFF